jgi:hypothetical protein
MSFESLSSLPWIRRRSPRLKGHSPVPGRLALERFENRVVMAANLFPLDQTFSLSSLPGAAKTIYLDFTGHRTVGTQWNADETDDSIVCFPYTDDAILTSPNFTFNASELGTIQQVWAAVAEDWAPFQINVTTKEPPVADLIKSSVSDQRWGMRAVISDAAYTPDENPASPAAGVAYLDSFSDSMRAVDTPCFVNVDGYETFPLLIATCITHEVGHSLGLEHHGGSSTGNPAVPPTGGNVTSEYYFGHGTGSTSWNALMGGLATSRVTQWSHGEYATASRPNQDDLAILTKAANGFTYRTDDVGNTFVTARGLTKPLGQVTQVAKGIIERNSDADMFVFSVAGGAVDIRATPLTVISPGSFDGANLDVGMAIYSFDKKLVAAVEPSNRLDAQYAATLPSGKYYAKIYGTGNGDPAINGYSNYGSLGQYTLTVTDTTPTPPVLPTVSVSGPALALSEGSLASFTITLSAAATRQFQVGYRTASGTAIAGRDFVSQSGVATFRPGMTTFTVTVRTIDDRAAEGYEDFYLDVISVPAGVTVAASRGTARIQFSDGGSPMSSAFAAAGALGAGATTAKSAAFARYRISGQ